MEFLIEVSTAEEILEALYELTDECYIYDSIFDPKILFLTGCSDAYMCFGNVKKVYVKEKDFRSAVVKKIGGKETLA